MPTHMLDTDTVSFALRGYGRVGVQLLEHRPSDLCISSITLAELRYGAELRRSRRLHRLIGVFAASVTVADFGSAAADRFGKVGAALAQRGAPIGPLDTLIAAHALALDLVLVTNNARHFDRIRDLRTENWV